MLGLNPAATAWLQLQMPEHARFRTACAKPANAQRDRLSIIVRANARTAFGRSHDFASVRTPADFAARVPMATMHPMCSLGWNACGRRMIAS